MGFFSWHTQDTNKVIWNCYGDGTSTVYMIDNKGNQWREDNYGGYGVFGGKDYYELLAEMNGLSGEGEELREAGIKLGCSEEPHLTPNLVSNPNRKWKNKPPKDHAGQGHWRA